MLVAFKFVNCEPLPTKLVAEDSRDRRWILSCLLSVNGSGLTSLNASNVTLGTLTVSRGGIGTTTLNNNQVLLAHSNIKPAVLVLQLFPPP